ncbi:hypothetical protein [Streptomyces lydicus]|uniref:hypothetical protein n=1 Tax=Streptomyces lydicus TaxID=47763 RepID=UPI003700B861
MTEQGVGAVVDFMPPASPHSPMNSTGWSACCAARVARLVDTEVAPGFDYARQPHEVTSSMGGRHFAGGGMELTIHVVDTFDDERLGDRRIRAATRS